jgi:hypothetical protein
MRQKKSITETKYFNALKEAKIAIELNNFSPTNWESNFKLSARTSSTLKKLGIIKNLGTNRYPSFEWNSKIPVTMLLAKKIISENNNSQNIYLENRILNKLQEPVVIAKPIVKQSPKQIVKPIQDTNQVGLIRRFLKWIY